MTSINQPVLILGAGINGAALAREFLLNRVPVCMVDTADICFGASAYSSRLIHGGLRYLEYGEFDLVRESLHERTRLLRLAPQFVRPLRLYIPVRTRLTGIVPTVERFFGFPRHGAAEGSTRGLWLVRMGLWFYEVYAHDTSLPHPAVHSVHDRDVPPVDDQKFRWLCSYYDAQVRFAERFVLALLEDARRLAVENNVSFQLHTYHAATLAGRVAEVRRTDPTPTVSNGDRHDSPEVTLEPAAIINATGAWVDHTLARLNVPAPRLMGGTKGSHLITSHRLLRERLGGNGIYAEATDGRPIFVLPFGAAVLIGTTDIPFDGDPQAAVADKAELDYLLEAVNDIVPGLGLGPEDVDLHYSGVRPLPYTDSSTPASITRRHKLQEHHNCDVPLFSVIGGKLTTCRSLAEEMTRTIMTRLGTTPIADSRTRVIPGGEAYPQNETALASQQQRVAAATGFSLEQVLAIWSLCGTRSEPILNEVNSWLPQYPDDREDVSSTAFPRGYVRWIIRHEWVTRLDDLVERRLLLHYNRNLSERCLVNLAELLVGEARLHADQVPFEVESCRVRLQTHFGKQLCQERPAEV